MNIVFKVSFFILLCLGIDAFAQRPKEVYGVDSLFVVGEKTEAEKRITKYSESKLPMVQVFWQLKRLEWKIRAGNIKEGRALWKSLNYGQEKPTGLAGVYAQTIEGQLLLAEGQVEDAKSLLEKTIPQLLLLTKQEQVLVAPMVWSVMGSAHWYSANNEMALEFHQKAIQERIQNTGNQYFWIASAYNDLGLDYANTNDVLAIEYFEKAKSIYEKYLPEGHEKLAYTYNNLALAFKRRQDFTTALSYLRKIETIYTKKYTSAHADVAFLKVSMAQVYAAQKADAIAEKFYAEAIQMYETLYGAHHPELASIYNELAHHAIRAKKLKVAGKNFDKAMFANQKDDTKTTGFAPVAYILNANTYLNTLVGKANTLEMDFSSRSLDVKQLKLALVALEKADSIIVFQRQIKKHKSDKLALAEVAAEVYQMGVRISLLLAENSIASKKYKQMAFSFAEKSKGAILAEAVADTKAKQYANFPDSLVQKEQKLTEALANLEQKIAESTQKNEVQKWRDAYFSTSLAYDRHIKFLETHYPAYYQLKYDRSMATIGEIQQKLDKNTVLVSYMVADSSQRFYTFVVTSNRFEVFDDPLDKNFDKWMKGFRNSILFKDDEDFLTISQKLYAIFWKNKIPARFSNVVLVQDARLGNVPLEALVTKKTSTLGNATFLNDRVSITYAFSAQLWLQSQKSVKNTSLDPSIFLCAPVEFQRMNALPGSETEVNQIKNLFQNKNLTCKAYTYKEASETMVKKQLGQPYKFVHLATHGMVNTTKPELSAVFLSESNDKTNDGKLYSGEIYNLKIQSELVSLSACETGLGRVTKGEGVIGLSRALFYAGAANMMVSLWTVSDRSTSILMEGFYKELLTQSNTSYAFSLAKAKRQLYSQPEFRSPYYWAAFILIGK